LRRLLAALGLTRSPSSPPKRILLIKLVEQGATVLAYDAMMRAIELVGRENVFFCCFEENRHILDVMDIIPRANIMTARLDSLAALIVDVLAILARVRREKIDAVVDMEFFARGSAVLTYLCGAARRVGIDRLTSEAPYRGDLMTHRVEYNPYIHTAVAYRLLVESLAGDPDQIPQGKVPTAQFVPRVAKFTPTEEDAARIRAMIPEATGPIFVLNPNSEDSLDVRKWPAENYIALGRRLLDHWPGAKIVLVGTPTERCQVEHIQQEIGAPCVLSLAGQTTLCDLIVLLSLADVLVTNDCGPAHFATLTDIHSVVLFGPETPDLFGPLGNRARVVRKRLACSPCLTVFNHRLSPCNDNVCIKTITVDEVFEQVAGCLEERTTS
jgi:ADP-heptose:LPS heptosyltransferase